MRLFLEFDGAALVYFSKKLQAQPQLPGEGETWANLAQELFLDTYEQYLQFITDPRTRTEIRQLAEKRRHAPFRGHSGRHQSLIHINTLFRLGLVDSSSTGHSRVYSAKRLVEGDRFATSELLSLAPDVASLEEIIRSQPLYQVVGRVLGIQCKNDVIDDIEFMVRVKEVYARVMETGVSLCALQTVYEALQIQSLFHAMVPQSNTAILSRLRALQDKAPSRIRFHVDRYGNPAYLRIDTGH